MNDLNVDGMAIAPNVVETIVSIAANEVEGVASVGQGAAGNIRSLFGGKNAAQGLEVSVNEEGAVTVAIHIEVYYGNVIPEVAAKLRTAIADALSTQVGVTVANIDVYVDGIQFAE